MSERTVSQLIEQMKQKEATTTDAELKGILSDAVYIIDALVGGTAE